MILPAAKEWKHPIKNTDTAPNIFVHENPKDKVGQWSKDLWSPAVILMMMTSTTFTTSTIKTLDFLNYHFLRLHLSIIMLN